MIVVECPECSAQFNVPASAIPAAGRTLKCSSCGHKWHFVARAVRASAPSEPPQSDDVLPVPEESADSAPSPEQLGMATDAGNFTLSSAPSFLNEPSTGENFSAILQKTSQAAGLAAPLPPLRSSRRMGALLRGYLVAAVVAAGVVWVLATNQMVVTTLFPRAQAAYDLFDMPIVIGQPDFTFENVHVKHTPATYTLTGAVKNRSSTQKNMWPIRATLFAKDQAEPMAVWVFKPAEDFINPGQELPFDVTRDFTDGDAVVRVELNVMTDVTPSKDK